MYKTVMVVNPGINMKHLTGHFSASFQASKTTNHGAPAQLSCAHHVLKRVLIKAVPRGGGKGKGKVNTAEISSCNQH